MIRIIGGILLFIFGLCMAVFRGPLFGIKEIGGQYSFFSLIMGMVSGWGLMLIIEGIFKIKESRHE